MVDYIEPEKTTPNYTEPSKSKVTTYFDQRSDWFYNGWFYGWFDNKSTPNYTEETK